MSHAKSKPTSFIVKLLWAIPLTVSFIPVLGLALMLAIKNPEDYTIPPSSSVTPTQVVYQIPKFDPNAKPPPLAPMRPVTTSPPYGEIIRTRENDPYGSFEVYVWNTEIRKYVKPGIWTLVSTNYDNIPVIPWVDVKNSIYSP